VPVVVSAVLLAVAAALVFLPESQRLAARYTALVGTGVLAGSVWATSTFLTAALGRHDVSTELATYGVEAGGGVPVLSAAVLVAVVGVVLLHARRPEPRPAGPLVYRVDDVGDEELRDAAQDDAGGGVRSDDVDTPAFGIPVVEVAQLPESDYRRSDRPDSGA
jgi:hypothetical protein